VKINMDISTFKSGDIIELVVDANAIPAGRYRFLETDGEMMILTVGNGAILGLATAFWKNFVRPVNKGEKRPTRESEFARRYVELYHEAKCTPQSCAPERFTFCLIDPNLMRRGGLSRRQYAPATQDPVIFN
jgi:hypothetical protein